MRTFPLGSLQVITTCVLLLFSLVPAFATPIISEIHYHPPHEERTPEPTHEEFIEIHNPDAAAIDLSGWKFTNGVTYTFPTGTTLDAGNYLVVHAPSWTGRLSNSGERITLSNASGETIDSVRYADGADWADFRRGPRSANSRGWTWVAPHDGDGASLERTSTSPALPSNSGQVWSSSTTSGGTPGTTNSTNADNIAPLLLDVEHSPALPRAGEPTIISARILDDPRPGLPSRITATLYYRDATSSSPPLFSKLQLFDDGFSGDLIPGDGIFSALIPGQPAGNITEFFVAASDSQGNSRTWPSPTDDSGTQGANAHFLTVSSADLEPYSLDPTIGHYRLITTATELDAFDDASTQSDALRSATFISLRNGKSEIRYRTFFRARGNGSRNRNPPPIKLIFPPGQPHDGLANTNINAYLTWTQHIGMLLSRASGIRSPKTRPVRLSFNGQDRADDDNTMYDLYVEIEPLDDDFVARAFPDGGAGNIYRKRSANPSRDTKRWGVHSGTPIYDQPFWFEADQWDKQTNASAYDFSDLQNFVEVMDQSSNDIPSVNSVIDTEQWLRWFAVNTFLGNKETNLSNGIDDDYAIYRPAGDTRFQLLPHDFDTIFHLGLSRNNPPIFAMINELNEIGGEDIIPQLIPFFENSEIRNRYFGHLQDLGRTTFNDRYIDELLTRHLPGRATAEKSRIETSNTRRTSNILNKIASPTDTAPFTLNLPRTSSYFVSSSPLATFTRSGTSVQRPLQPGFNHITLSLPTGRSQGFDIFYTISSTNPLRLSEIRKNGSTQLDVEVENTSNSILDLSSYTIAAQEPGTSSLPLSGMLQPGNFTSFTYQGSPETLVLLHNDAEIDSVITGAVPEGFSLSRIPNFPGGWDISEPTLGSANQITETAAILPATLYINEWLPAPRPAFTDEFIELYNPDLQGSLPVALGGLELTDDGINTASSTARHRLPHHTFLAVGSYAVFKPEFKISSYSELIRLVTPDRTVIDQVFTSGETAGTSAGREFPNFNSIRNYTTPTPGAPNGDSAATPYLEGLRISEFDADSGSRDFIELTNVSLTPLEMEGVRITGAIEFTFPALTLPPGGYTVVSKSVQNFGDIEVAGNFEGSLSDGGDKIIIHPPGDAATTPAVIRFDYDGSWYRGDTHYITARPSTLPSAYGERESWRPATGSIATPGAPPIATLISPTRLRTPLLRPLDHRPTLTSSSGAPLSFALSLDAPAWVSVDSSSGLLSGTPSALGVSEFSLLISDSGETLSIPYEILVTPEIPPTITVVPESTALVRVPFSTTFEVQRASTGVDIADLPSWLTFDPTTLTISGTPPVEALNLTQTITVTASNTTASVSSTITIQVNPEPLPQLLISEESSATSGVAFSLTFSAIQATSGITVVGLPTWLTYDFSTLTISGIPPEEIGSTTESITITAQNSSGSIAVTHTISLIVDPLAAAVETPDLTFTTSGALPWVVVPFGTFDGSPSLRSGAITDDQSSSLFTTIETTVSSTLGFAWRASSELGWDRLRLYIDNEEIATIEGEEPWQTRSIPLDLGTSIIEWRYFKDSQTSNGEDAGFLDAVTLTGYDPWARRNNVSGIPLTTDLDGDGLALIHEFVLGFPPRTAKPFPAPQRINGVLQWDFPNANIPIGIDIEFQSSPDLSPDSWIPVFTPSGALRQIIQPQFTERRFYRLRATVAPRE